MASGNALVSEAGGLSFNFWTGQIEHSVASGSQPLQHFFERSCAARVQLRGDGPRKLVTRFGVIQRVYKERFNWIPGRVKPKIIKIGVHKFLIWLSESQEV